MSKEMITLAFGVVSTLSILAGLLQIPKEMFNSLSERLKRIVTILVILGMVAGCAAQAIQYKQALDSDNGKRDAESMQATLSKQALDSDKEKRDTERKFARLLFLFNTEKRDLSREYLRDDPYVAGYQAMHHALKNNKEFTAAEAHLDKAIKSKKFVPESHYLLAYISLVNYERGNGPKDLSKAMQEATKAITEDPEYMAPHYLRSIVKVNSNMADAGMEDLKIAVTQDGIQCANLQHDDEIKRWWRKIAQEQKFKNIQAECSARWHLPAS